MLNNILREKLSSKTPLTTNYPSVYSTNRPPYAKDDTTRGWSVGQYWQWNGNIWIATSVTANAAVWTLQTSVSGYICDNVTGAVGAYGVFKLSASYGGYAFQVTRASDSTTLNIGFVGNVADWASVDTFIASTTGTISILYDQSGSGYNLTPGGSFGPKIFPSVTVNGTRCISFNGPVLTQYLINTSLPITNVRNMSIALIGQQYFGQFSNVLYEIGNPTAAFSEYALTNSGINNASRTAATNPQVFLNVMNGASSQTLLQNDVSAGPVATPASSASTGITLANGLGDVSYPGGLDLLSFIIYNSTLSAGNQATLLQSAYTVSGIQPQCHDVLALVGDSITQGNALPTGGYNALIYARLIQGMIARPFTYSNNGVGGTQAANQASSAATISANTYRANARNFATVFIGTNDLAANISAATCYASIQSIISTYRTTGFTKFAVATILPRSAVFSNGQNSAGFETSRLALNTLIRNGLGTDFDALIDLGGDSVLGNPAVYLTATYSIDNVHPTALGHQLIANLFTSSTATLFA